LSLCSVPKKSPSKQMNNNNKISPTNKFTFSHFTKRVEFLIFIVWQLLSLIYSILCKRNRSFDFYWDQVFFGSKKYNTPSFCTFFLLTNIVKFREQHIKRQHARSAKWSKCLIVRKQCACTKTRPPAYLNLIGALHSRKSLLIYLLCQKITKKNITKFTLKSTEIFGWQGNRNSIAEVHRKVIRVLDKKFWNWP